MARLRAPVAGICRLRVEGEGDACSSSGNGTRPACGLAWDPAATGPASPLMSTRQLVPELGTDLLKLQRLGKGATSSVYMAVHVRTLEVLALKEVEVRTPEQRGVVRSELQALRTQRSPLMDHTWDGTAACPWIVKFYGGYMQRETMAVLAVEYVGGGSLQQWIDRSERAPEPWLAHVAQCCLHALAALHESGRTHRDVKPANILLTCCGDAKLADFGCASGSTMRTMVGTRRYMAPERLKGQPVVPKSDVWSLGLALAAAALGECPVAQAQNEFEQLQEAERVAGAVQRAPGLSAELRCFLSRCLARAPSSRAAVSDLLEHPFLTCREGWRNACPTVPATILGHRRSVCLPIADVVAEVVQARTARGLSSTTIVPEALTLLACALSVSEPVLAALFREAAEDAASRNNAWGSGASACGTGVFGSLSLLARPQNSRTASRKWSMSSELGTDNGSCHGSNSGDGRLPASPWDDATFAAAAASTVTPARDLRTPVCSDALLCTLAERMHVELPVRDRMHHLRLWRRVFVGRDAVAWLRGSGAAPTTAAALAIGNEMLRMGIFSHVTAEHVFEDANLFYRFSDDMDTQAARRQRQRARARASAATAPATVASCASSPSSAGAQSRALLRTLGSILRARSAAAAPKGGLKPPRLQADIPVRMPLSANPTASLSTSVHGMHAFPSSAASTSTATMARRAWPLSSTSAATPGDAAACSA